MTQSELLEILERHRKWLAKESDGRPADLRGADLYKCCLPLSRGGTCIKLGRMQMAQLIYQFCSMECDDSEMLTLQKSLYVFANEFAEWYGNIKKNPGDRRAIMGNTRLVME